MKQSEQLYRIAGYIKRYGFDFHGGDHGGPRCFAGASDSIGGPHMLSTTPLWQDMKIDLWASVLRREQWTKRDAIAACEMAGDIAAARRL